MPPTKSQVKCTNCSKLFFKIISEIKRSKTNLALGAVGRLEILLVLGIKIYVNSLVKTVGIPST